MVTISISRKLGNSTSAAEVLTESTPAHAASFSDMTFSKDAQGEEA